MEPERTESPLPAGHSPEPLPSSDQTSTGSGGPVGEPAGAPAPADSAIQEAPVAQPDAAARLADIVQELASR